MPLQVCVSKNRSADKYIIRLPDGMRDCIRNRAAENRRSMNAEIIHHLDRALSAQNEKGPAEAATSPSHAPKPDRKGKTMNREHSTVGLPAASDEQSAAETASLPDVIDRLYRAMHFTEIASIAADSMSDQRIRSALAVTLDHIGGELLEVRRELYTILGQEQSA